MAQDGNAPHRDASPPAAADPYEPLLVLMRRFGATCSPREFYWAVNHAFHAAAAEGYDHMLRDMFVPLWDVWARLLRHLPPVDARPQLRFLDVGCGTGLVGDILTRLCANRVEELTLLDPSAPMLAQCRRKSAAWPFPCRFLEGDLSAAPDHPAFDVITMDSVLHHVVELEAFLRRASDLLDPGGLILTAQDERAESTEDSVFLSRRAGAGAARPLVRRMLRRARNAIRAAARRLGYYRQVPLAAATNEVLLRGGTIRRRMDLDSINAVTDYHITGQPGRLGRGIKLAQLQDWLPGVERMDYFTYAFHGRTWSSLTEEQRRQEEAWLSQGDPHGQTFASAWRKPPAWNHSAGCARRAPC